MITSFCCERERDADERFNLHKPPYLYTVKEGYKYQLFATSGWIVHTLDINPDMVLQCKLIEHSLTRPNTNFHCTWDNFLELIVTDFELLPREINKVIAAYLERRFKEQLSGPDPRLIPELNYFD